MNSSTEPGQPCDSSSGIGFAPLPCTCRKWMSMPSMRVLNCGQAFNCASVARQS